MIFNKHSDIPEGTHAFLGASNYHWTNYDDTKLIQTYKAHMAKREGTELHELAKRLIDKKVKLPRNKNCLNAFVNDAIGFRMKTEQVLYYSPYCFGTTDAISFDNNLLRIHDLKTGTIKASMQQLIVYAALFCLEYKYEPAKIDTELRIYQYDLIMVHIPKPEEIKSVMDKIIKFDDYIAQCERGEI